MRDESLKSHRETVINRNHQSQPGEGGKFPMKKVLALFAAACLCLAGAFAQAEGGVQVEVIRADGVSVVVLTPDAASRQARGQAESDAEERTAKFVLPQLLTVIEEGAFEGIPAKRVEVSENVVVIESHAFAHCRNLREFLIPESVEKIDRSALEGCRQVTVYGTTEVAKRFAEANRFTFVDLNAPAEDPGPSSAREKQPVELPLVRR